MLEAVSADRVERGHEEDLTARLESTLVKEAELLGGLRAIFRKQRDAIVAGDPERLDDGVFAATRLMRTLEEARGARRKVTRGLLGSELDFLELDDVLTGPEHRGLRVARAAVLEEATALIDEVSLLRGALQVLLDDNRRCLDALLGDDAGATAIAGAKGPGSDAGGSSGARTVLDRKA